MYERNRGIFEMNNQRPLEMWTLYYSPKDYPGEFVVRKWIVNGSNETEAREITAREKSKYEAQMNGIPHWAVCIGRYPEDDNCIVGTWV
jgi:hypothetical protein